MEGDIRSATLVNYVLKSKNIDTIVHFAAQTHVDNSFGNSLQFTQNNVVGTHVLLEAAKNADIKRFIHVSTDEVYGEAEMEDEGMIETKALEPTNPYAASKAAAEFLVKAYHRSFKLPVIITRGNNVYGPHQFPEKLIPKFVSLLERGRKLCMHGTGENRRNFIYVTDVARAFDTIVHKGHIGSIYNVGSELEMSNIQVARFLLKYYGKEDQEDDIIEYVEDRPFNDFRYVINSDKLIALGWKPEVEWQDGLKRTIEWYKKFGGRNWGPDIGQFLAAHPRRGAGGNEEIH